MKKQLMVAVPLWFALSMPAPASAQQRMSGLRGEPEAIADAVAMVETMGGMALWAQLESLHFVHRWFPYQRIDSYVENEVLDLTGPRSRTDQLSEIASRTRVYGPEGGYWVIQNGAFSRGSDATYASSIERAPFNFYRLVHGVAIGDPFYEVRYGAGDIPGSRRLEFRGPDHELHGWVILNARMEPIVKATTTYRYTLGPLRQFGNIRVPDWGVYDNGYTRYEMISLVGSNHAPDPALFVPPADTSAHLAPVPQVQTGPPRRRRP